LDTVAHGEAVEAELDRLIERRSRNGEADPDERDPGRRVWGIRKDLRAFLALPCARRFTSSGATGGEGGTAVERTMPGN
jgi:hypothetical protein